MTFVIDGQYVRRRKRNDPSSPVALTCSLDRPEEERMGRPADYFQAQ